MIYEVILENSYGVGDTRKEGIYCTSISHVAFDWKNYMSAFFKEVWIRNNWSRINPETTWKSQNVNRIIEYVLIYTKLFLRKRFPALSCQDGSYGRLRGTVNKKAYDSSLRHTLVAVESEVEFRARAELKIRGFAKAARLEDSMKYYGMHLSPEISTILHRHRKGDWGSHHGYEKTRRILDHAEKAWEKEMQDIEVVS